MPYVTKHMLSHESLLKKRQSFEKKRQKAQEPHTIHFFHQVDDPYSCLLAEALPVLYRKFDVQVEIHLVEAPGDAFAPERQKLMIYSRRDASLLAKHFSLNFMDPSEQPSSELILKSQKLILDHLKFMNALDQLSRISQELWMDQNKISDSPNPLINNVQLQDHLAKSNQLRNHWGHYLGGTIYYGGEWYWGIDRLYHLEDRLLTLKVQRDFNTSQFPIQTNYLFPPDTLKPHTGQPKQGQTIDFFFSFRSPYSAIVAPRIFDLAKKHQVQVNLRFVLPMVMRGLPVPMKKRMYISRDTAREAFFRDIPFGKLNDPVGPPTERGLSLIPLAEQLGCGQKYVLSFMRGVWSEGFDAGSDRDLKKITDRCEIPWNLCELALKDEQWRSQAELNRTELFSLGLWGVPSFKINNLAVWGQDRLWAIEDELFR